MITTAIVVVVVVVSSCYQDNSYHVCQEYLGPQHPSCQAFINKEEREVLKYNDAARRLNEVSGQYLIGYKRNRYTGSMPLSPGVQ
jgi:hypothetical protein